ncbi:MAG: hypothetical protein Kow00129_10990 [Thermoleophilia bacterium]
MRILGLLGMFVFAGILVTAGGTYLWLNYMMAGTKNPERSREVAEYIEGEQEIREQATEETGFEDPPGMDILLLGSDGLQSGEEYGRSDTMMLVHIDPDAKFAAVLSLPRDLRVPIPGYGVQKLNAAYALGGPRLAIETVTEITGILPDHYVNIDFDAFREVTTEIGGIYVDVDRRYYNDSASYEWINLKPGYQKLWGEEALDYVRFRHDSNGDFGRILRQQRFLKAAKEQAFRWDTVTKLPEVVKLVLQNVETDLGTQDVLRLAYWGIRLGPDRIRQVSLEAGTDMIDGISYVIAGDDAIREAVDRLLEPPAGSPAPGEGEGSDEAATAEGEAEGEDGSADGGAPSDGANGSDTPATTAPGGVDLTGITVNVLNGNGRPGEANAGAKFLRNLGAAVNRVGDAPDFDYSASVVYYPADKAGAAGQVARAVGTDELIVDDDPVITVVLGADFAVSEEFRQEPTLPEVPNAADWKSLAGQTSFDLMAPALVPDGYSWKDHRVYDIQTDDGPRAALKVYYKLRGEDQYLGIMQTTFTDAPAAAAGDEVQLDGRSYTVVDYEGNVDRVWWKQNGVLYWVSNTLSYRLDREEMLAIAQSMVEVK